MGCMALSYYGFVRRASRLISVLGLGGFAVYIFNSFSHNIGMLILNAWIQRQSKAASRRNAWSCLAATGFMKTSRASGKTRSNKPKPSVHQCMALATTLRWRLYGKLILAYAPILKISPSYDLGQWLTDLTRRSVVEQTSTACGLEKCRWLYFFKIVKIAAYVKQCPYSHRPISRPWPIAYFTHDIARI